MNTISDYLIHERLPESINQKNAQEVAEVIDNLMLDFNEDIAKVIIYPAIDKLDSDLVNALAIQLHCDFYDDALPLETRRGIVKQSIGWHRIKGTKKAVQDMANIVYPAGKVLEWFEYAGEPYHFQISLKDAPMNLDEIERIGRLVNESKNTRSWLDAITFKKNVECKLYMGAACTQYKTIDIMPITVADENIEAQQHIAGGAYIFKSVNIGPITVENTELNFNNNATMGLENFKSINIGPAAVGNTDVKAEAGNHSFMEEFKKINITQIGYKEE